MIPKNPHLIATKRILKYIKGTMKLGLLFPSKNKETKANMVDYSDLH